MAYVKNIWVDQDVERPKTYEVTNNQDGSITLTDSFGVVTELGTPVNADNMNHIEDGIAQCYVDLTDIDLLNLTETGEKHFINKTQITSCLLEAPNRVQYTLTSGALTIKAGSVVLIPYGTTDQSSTITVGSTFINSGLKVADTYWDSTNSLFYVWAELQSDVTRAAETGGATLYRKITLSCTDSDIDISTIQTTKSVSSDSAVTESTVMWYNTTTNLVKIKSSGTVSTYTHAFPIMVIKQDATYRLAEVSQVFNGIGYIGGVIWADKGLKYLRSNGRNADGTLNNIENTTNTVQLLNLGAVSDGSKTIIFNSSNVLGYSGYSDRGYNPETNYFYSTEIINGVWCVLGEVNLASGTITAARFENALNINALCGGKWSNKTITLASNVTWNSSSSTATYDLSSYLPNDGCDYEVLFTATAGTDNTSGKFVTVSLTTDLCSNVGVCSVRTRTASTMDTAGSTIIPVGVGRYVQQYASSSSNAGGNYTLIALGYRRLGRGL